MLEHQLLWLDHVYRMKDRQKAFLNGKLAMANRLKDRPTIHFKDFAWTWNTLATILVASNDSYWWYVVPKGVMKTGIRRNCWRWEFNEGRKEENRGEREIMSSGVTPTEESAMQWLVYWATPNADCKSANFWPKKALPLSYEINGCLKIWILNSTTW